MSPRLFGLSSGLVAAVAALFASVTSTATERAASARGPTCSRHSGRLEIIGNLRRPDNRLYHRTAAARRRHRQYITINAATCASPGGNFTRHPAAPSARWRVCGQVQDRSGRIVRDQGRQVFLCKFVRAPSSGGGGGSSSSGGGGGGTPLPPVRYLVDWNLRPTSGETCRGYTYATSRQDVALRTELWEAVNYDSGPNCPHDERRKISVRTGASPVQLGGCSIWPTTCGYRVSYTCADPRMPGNGSSCPGTP